MPFLRQLNISEPLVYLWLQYVDRQFSSCQRIFEILPWQETETLKTPTSPYTRHLVRNAGDLRGSSARPRLGSGPKCPHAKSPVNKHIRFHLVSPVNIICSHFGKVFDLSGPTSIGVDKLPGTSRWLEVPAGKLTTCAQRHNGILKTRSLGSSWTPWHGNEYPKTHWNAPFHHFFVLSTGPVSPL